MDAWCTDNTKTTMMLGISKNRSEWLHGVASRVQKYPMNSYYPRDSIQLNIENYSGNYYISIQRLYTTVSNTKNSCNVDIVYLKGITYSYANSGL